ncbi:MAG: hypothetical protein JRM77_09335 [Nitrososphaerota archaeon]|nr:hypothetical protein [Nitrososphaerota archaeon]
MLLLFTGVLLSTTPSVAQSQPSQPTLNVTYVTHLEPRFTLYGHITQQMYVEVNGSVVPSGTPTLITIDFPYSYGYVAGLPAGGNFSLQSSQSSSNSYTILTVQIPPNDSLFGFTFEGYSTGLSSLFFRDIAFVPPIFVSMNKAPYSAELSVLVAVSTLQVRSVFPSNSSEIVNIAGADYLQISPAAILASAGAGGVALVYQSPLSDYYAFLAIAALAAAALLIPLALRRFWPKISADWLKIPLFLRRFTGNVTRRRGTKTLLVALMIVSLTMITLSTIFGPPPQPRAYVAATPSTSEVIGSYVSQAGWSYLSTANGGDGFSRTSDLGTFSAAIIADYPPAVSAISPSQGGLSYVPYIIVLKQYVSSAYLAQVLALHPYNTIVLNSPSEIPAALAQVGGRQNVLGLTISEGLYYRVAAAIGAMSFLVPFFALAFFASMAVDLGGGGPTGVFETAGYAIMVYFLADFAFIVSSVMLGTPIAMHAAISNKETAEGLLGPFGGGSRPRELAGALGIVVGIIYNKKGALSLDRNIIIAFAAFLMFVMADPLNVASLVYQLMLAVSSSVGVGVTGPAYALLRSVIGQPMILFQSYVTPGFVASHGAVLFFISALPLFLYSRVGKGTGTLLLLFASLGCGIGFERVADLIPMETIASAAPGFALGAVVLAAFWAMNMIETVVRRGPLVGK